MQTVMNIKRLVKKEVAVLKAYSAREIPCRIKLDANESPYGFEKDPEAKQFRKLMARELKTEPSQILQGNGSDELIYYLTATFGGPVLYPVPTFSMYGIIAQALGEEKRAVRLDAEFDLDIDAMAAAVRKDKPRLIFLSSPNNPTGNCFSAEKILRIIEASPGIVVVDEAYQPFSSRSGFLPFLKDYRNLVIMRTLSKIGLASLRLGFMVADPAIIEEVNKVRLPFNVNALSQAVAVAALREKKQMAYAVKMIVSERERLFAEMSGMTGVKPFPSEANFILFQVSRPDAVYGTLLDQGILVRNINDVVKGCLRVTVGTPGENTAFLRALAKSVRTGR
jgi:histidinol-phosphate aminotransferase